MFVPRRIAPPPLPRLRRVCLALPETFEKEAWGAPTFRVTKGKMFAMYSTGDHPKGAGRPQVWVNCTLEDQAFLLGAHPRQYFSPPYVGAGGWVGAWLDEVADWRALAELLADGWRRAAPKALLRSLDAAPRPTTRRRSR